MSNPMIRFEVKGALKAALRFEQFPNALRDELLTEIAAIGREAFELVAAAVLRRTGLLATQERLTILNEPDRVGAVVDFNGAGATQNDFKKQGALEYGSKGDAQDVSAQVRSLDHVFNRKLAAPLLALVGAYRRTPNLTPDSFVRGPMAAMQANALSRLQTVVERSAQQE